MSYYGYGSVGPNPGHIDTADHFVSATLAGSPETRVEPLGLSLVKQQRRYSTTTLDELFLIWIAASRQYLEEATGRQLITATWEYWLDRFPWSRTIELPHPPLQSIVSVKYDDANGDEQTMDDTDYRIIAPSGDYGERGRLVLSDTAAWPSTRCHAKAVRIQYVAGYGDAATDMPALVTYALLMLVGHFHKFAEEISEARANILQLPIGADQVIKALKYSALPQLNPPSAPGWLGPSFSDVNGSWPWR